MSQNKSLMTLRLVDFTIAKDAANTNGKRYLKITGKQKSNGQARTVMTYTHEVIEAVISATPETKAEGLYLIGLFEGGVFSAVGLSKPVTFTLLSVDNRTDAKSRPYIVAKTTNANGKPVTMMSWNDDVMTAATNALKGKKKSPSLTVTGFYQGGFKAMALAA